MSLYKQTFTYRTEQAALDAQVRLEDQGYFDIEIEEDGAGFYDLWFVTDMRLDLSGRTEVWELCKPDFTPEFNRQLEEDEEDPELDYHLSQGL
jgi:hypothetical protein